MKSRKSSQLLVFFLCAFLGLQVSCNTQTVRVVTATPAIAITPTITVTPDKIAGLPVEIHNWARIGATAGAAGPVSDFQALGHIKLDRLPEGITEAYCVNYLAKARSLNGEVVTIKRAIFAYRYADGAYGYEPYYGGESCFSDIEFTPKPQSP